MKVKDLIEQLQKMPQDMNVHVFDHNKNLERGGGDNCSDGIYDFDVAIVPDDETVKLMREAGEEISQWVGIVFDNDDYEENDDLSKIRKAEKFDEILAIVNKAVLDNTPLEDTAGDVIHVTSRY